MKAIELSHLSRQCLNRRIADKSTFIHEIAEWNKNRDAEEATIDWQFTTNNYVLQAMFKPRGYVALSSCP